jgi:hypothetical protein
MQASINSSKIEPQTLTEKRMSLLSHIVISVFFESGGACCGPCHRGAVKKPRRKRVHITMQEKKGIWTVRPWPKGAVSRISRKYVVGQ